ncbi:hypothetical protein F2Q68_00042370 [Brassica cretica]|uniref:F-box domain-containing protein n=1 Tax=Brassica cretica TaxID=69181 RepID=A0A8S9MLC8_BRACR|nr:hypothetical protein F2Q68_00042370 [Brassica cretica]
MYPPQEEDSSASNLKTGKRALDDDELKDDLRHTKSRKLTDDDSLINDIIGRDISISCLIRCSRSDYASIASLNRSFRSLVKSGAIYKLRRQNRIIEHWVYFSCQLLEWVAFDPVERRWMNLPTMRSGDTFMCTDKESLAVGTDLLVLGKDDGSSHVVYRYSLLTNSWSPGKKMNSPRCLFGSASLGEIAIFAGGCDSLGKISDVAEMYNSELQTWTTLPKMNKPRKPRSREMPASAEAPPLVAVVNNELYAADHAGMVVRKYDKGSKKWFTLGRLPERAGSVNGWGLAFRACGERLIVIGGPKSSGGGFIELNSWIPTSGGSPPVWTLLDRKHSSNFVYNCAVMGC